MADRPPYPDSSDDSGMGPDGASPPGMPRWVKVSGIIVVALLLVFVGLQLAGVGGDHGPGRHGPGGAQDANASSVTPAASAGHDPSRRNH